MSNGMSVQPHVFHNVPLAARTSREQHGPKERPEGQRPGLDACDREAGNEATAIRKTR